MNNISRFQNFKVNENLSISSSIQDVENFISEQGIDDTYIYYDESSDTLMIDVLLLYKDKYQSIINTLENEYGWFLFGSGADFEEFYMDSDNMDGMKNGGIQYNLDEMSEEGYEDTDELFKIHFKPIYADIVNGFKYAYYLSEKSNINDIIKNGIKVDPNVKWSLPPRTLLFTDRGSYSSDANCISKSEYFEDIVHPVLIVIDPSNIQTHKYPSISSGVYTTDDIKSSDVKWIELPI